MPFYRTVPLLAITHLLSIIGCGLRSSSTSAKINVNTGTFLPTFHSSLHLPWTATLFLSRHVLLQERPYLAYSTARVSRMTVTRICPG